MSSKSKHSVYVTSVTTPSMIGLWKSLRDKKGWRICSTWFDEPLNIEGRPALWMRIQDEIVACSGLILYAQRSNLPLRAALVEVGLALANNKPVIVVPDRNCSLIDSLGSWVDHPGVALEKTLDSAYERIMFMAVARTAP
jgi:hypothetical protein